MNEKQENPTLAESTTNIAASTATGFAPTHEAPSKRTRPRPQANRQAQIEIEQEQEQEQQIEIIQQSSRSYKAAMQLAELGHLQTLSADNFDIFYLLLQLNGFKTTEDAAFITEKEAEILWNNLFCKLENETNDSSSALEEVSYQALEQLLTYRRQLKSGLDFNHLPSGFFVVEYPEGSQNRVLHFDASREKASLLAPVLTREPAPKAITPPVLEKLLAHPSAGTFKLFWDSVQTEKELKKIIQQHVLLLLTYDEESLITLLQINTPNDTPNAEHFNFFLSHTAAIAQLEQPNQKLNEIYGDSASQVLAFAKKVSAYKDSHLVWLTQILDENPALLTQIKDLKKQTPSIQEEALLTLFNETGVDGLEKLVTLWKTTPPSNLKTLHEACYRHLSNYAPLLTEKHQNTLKIIASFNTNEAQWWTSLLNIHSKHVGADDLPSLVESFTQFLKQIKEKGLILNALPEGTVFPGAESLSITLSRIVSFLDQCKKTHLQAQWAHIPKLNFSATGVTRTLADAKAQRKSCHFITPEMQVGPKHYAEIGNVPEPLQWQAIGKITDIATLKRDFYRLVAEEEKPLSLSFYEEACEDIEKLHRTKKINKEAKHQLFGLLLASTQGEINHKFLNANEKEEWKKLLNTLENAKLNVPLLSSTLPPLANKLIDVLYETVQAPPLPTLVKLSTMIANILSTTKNPAALVREGQKLLDVQYELDVMLHNCGHCVYQGMTFYDDEDYAKHPSVFYTHTEVGKVLLEKGINPAYHFLISVISTFQINTKEIAANMAERLTLSQELIGNEVFKEVEKLLAQMKTNRNDKGSKLNSNDLQQFLTQLAVQSHDKQITLGAQFNPKQFSIEFVQKEFNQYFDPDFFKKLTAMGISPETQRVLDTSFPVDDEKQQVTHFLKHFSQPGESATYNTLIHLLLDVSEAERPLLLKVLERPEIYNNPTLGIDKMQTLLEAILKRGHVQDFVYFMSQNATYPAHALAEKATFYLEELLPEIETKKGKTLPRMDSARLISQFVLSGTLEHFKEKKEVKKDSNETEDLIQLLEEYKLKDTIDTSFFEEQLQTYKDRFKEISSLIRQLETVNNPTRSLPQQGPKLEPTPAPSSWGSYFYQSFSSFFGRSTPTIKEAVVVDEPVIESIDLQPEIEKAITALKQKAEKEKQYEQAYSKSFNDIYALAEIYPAAKTQLIDFIACYIQDHKEKTALLENTAATLELLKEVFLKVNNANVVLSLCHHFNGQDGHLPPADLLALLNLQEFKLLVDEQKNTVLTLIAALLNNNKQLNKEDIQNLLQRTNSNSLLERLKQWLQNPPFPDLEKLKEWDEKASHQENYVAVLNAFHSEFDRKPCEREVGDGAKIGNGFSLTLAKHKLSKFSHKESLEPDLEALFVESRDMRELSTQDLIGEFKRFRQNPRPEDCSHTKLVAISAELLYRAKGKEGLLGSSYEINTTQYLAILGMLNGHDKSVSEIGTGEGKSRIMAVYNACAYGLGQTVDFVTSNMNLATRDYLDFLDFFQMLGAKTSIIHAYSEPEDYCLDGINYSEVGNLSLFRSKAIEAKREHLVIQADPTKRALMADEGDKLLFDTANTRFNFSENNKLLKGMEWVYPKLIEFFAQDNLSKDKPIHTLYYDDVEACNEAFIHFVARDAEHLEQIKKIPLAQIETWLEAAMTAQSLVYDKDYLIDANITITTPFGPKIASDAKLIIDNQKSSHTRFSYGVHQCLHAYLNYVKRFPQEKLQDQALIQHLKECEYDFDISAEKQIILSSNAKSFIDDYATGKIKAITGTMGSEIEQQEARRVFEGLEFMTVPRHQGLHRIDKPVRLTANHVAQVKSIVQYIRECRIKGQPILLINEHDKDSKIMLQTLQQELGEAQMQLIDNQLSAQEQERRIALAGQAGMVTVSTAMVGRGNDFKIAPEVVQQGGLAVLITYLPRMRDLKQIQGRSGRAGQKGEARIILNKEKVKKALGKTSLKDGFYTNNVLYLQEQQQYLDKAAQSERLIINTKNTFDKVLTNHYFNDLRLNVEEKEILGTLDFTWATFQRQKDQAWNKIWPQIKATSSFESVSQYLQEYRANVETLWTETRTTMLKAVPSLVITEETAPLEIPNHLQAFLLNTDTPKKTRLSVPIAQNYDKAYDGRAVIYTRLFEETRALFRGERQLFANFRAWKRGEGILFPRLRAFWNGTMSLRQYLFGGLASHGEDKTSETPFDGQSDTYSRVLRATRHIEPLGESASEPISTPTQASTVPLWGSSSRDSQNLDSSSDNDKPNPHSLK